MSEHIKNIMSSISSITPKKKDKKKNKLEDKTPLVKKEKPPRKQKPKDDAWYRKKLGVKVYANKENILEVYEFTKYNQEIINYMCHWLRGSIGINENSDPLSFSLSPPNSTPEDVFTFKMNTTIIRTNGITLSYIEPENIEDLKTLIENQNFTQIEPKPKVKKDKYVIDPYDAGSGPEPITCPHECFRCQHLYPELPDYYGFTKKGKKKEFGKKFDCIGEEGCPAIKIQLENQKYTKDEVHAVVNNLVIGKDIGPISEFVSEKIPVKEDTDIDKKKYYRMLDEINWEFFFQIAQSYPDYLEKYNNLIK